MDRVTLTRHLCKVRSELKFRYLKTLRPAQYFWSFTMVSNTGSTRIKRENKKAKSGKKRKANNRNKGTTPKFSVHVEKK